MHNILTGLNEAQQQAVMHGEGPALVVAGPGSGKTTVIVKRILYLIQVHQIPPEQILVVTFTKEAALSMQSRFFAPSTIQQPVHFGTFHSYFYHILLDAHGNRNLKILNNTQKKNLLYPLLRQVIQEKDSLKEAADVFLSAIGYYKNTMDRDGAVQMLGPGEQKYFDQIFNSYQDKVRREQALDFDDMVYECLKLLQNNPAYLQKWQKRFAYYLIDEFQDINPIQYEVIKLLTAKNRNVFVVGDEDQSIYGFRGSNPDCMRKFYEDYGARQIVLSENYRSSGEIVTVSNMIIQENRNRFAQEKCAVAVGANKDIRESVHLQIFETKTEEYAYLVERLRAFHKTNVGSDASCGVLFRTNTAMQTLAMQLQKEGIPFLMREKTNLVYEHFIVQDLMAYLKFAAGDNRRELFLRFMNKPLRYISRDTLGEHEFVTAENIKAANPQVAFELKRLFMQLKQVKGMTLPLALRFVWKGMGYEGYLQNKKEAKEHMEEWQDLFAFLVEESKGYKDVYAWEKAQTETIEMMKHNHSNNQLKNASDMQTEKLEIKEEEIRLQLMTVHAAKGLEFDHVFIPDCNEKVFPYGKLQSAETIEEERRIFYVAVTRAKKDLELLGLKGTKERPRQLSRFLNPILSQQSHQIRSCQDTRQMHLQPSHIPHRYQCSPEQAPR